MLWIDYFRERDTTRVYHCFVLHSCGLITLGNEIQPIKVATFEAEGCGLITLGNEIQRSRAELLGSPRCGLITLGNEIQPY